MNKKDIKEFEQFREDISNLEPATRYNNLIANGYTRAQADILKLTNKLFIKKENTKVSKKKKAL